MSLSVSLITRSGYHPEGSTISHEYWIMHFEYNITHNLNRMAGAAGIYEALWRPENIDATAGADLIEPLRAGLEELKSKPAVYTLMNPENGWGDYKGLIKFVERYLEACREHPEAEIQISR
jgi:hypothetical protein